MIIAASMLLAALIGGLVARAVGLPPLVGFLVAGFVLAAFDVPLLPQVATFADLGVTILLFAVGLKLDVKGLLRREVWATALLHTAMMTTIGSVILLGFAALGIGLLADLSAETVALIAFAISFSSTVFAVRILDERNATRSRYGQIALGILVVQDLLAVGYVAFASGQLPSLWAFGLVLLLPARHLFAWVLSEVGHGELLVLFGVVMALVPGFMLFHLVDIKGDLGAIVVGMLLSSHPRAPELARAIFGLKGLLLVAFFLSIGLQGLPSLDQVGVALLLLLLLPLQSLGYILLVSWFSMRRRTATLAGLTIANNSEFGLIVAAKAIAAGFLAEGWLTTMSVAVAGGFLVSTFANRYADKIADVVEHVWPDPEPSRLDPHERPIPLHDVDALVLGLGRIGATAMERLAHTHGLRVMGIEQDEERAEHLQAQGADVLVGDASDQELWRRLVAVRTLDTVVLAMPFHEANLVALRTLRSRGFAGRVAAVALYDDEADRLKELGADEVLHLYSGAGAALADAAVGESDRPNH